MTETAIQPVQATKWRGPLRLGCGVVVALSLLLVLFTALMAVRIVPPAQGVWRDLRSLQALDPSVLAEADPARLAELRDRFASLEHNLDQVGSRTAPFMPLVGHLGWLPGMGAEIHAAPELLELGSGLATAGRAAMDGAIPVLEAYQQPGEGSALARVAPVLQETAPSWQEAQTALERVAAARSQLDLASLDPRLADQVQRLDGYLPLLQAGVGLAGIAPSLLGVQEPRTYLLLAQNNDELRPTGGFITGAGLITVDGGAIGQLDFQDSYGVYKRNKDHPLAPPDLERYMQAQILLFRDSNWSPDFPTSAMVAQSLYQLNTGQASDGVIAFDVEAARRVVSALEPLVLPGYQEPVTAKNLVRAMRDVWETPTDTDSTVVERINSDWWFHRKDFMGDLAAAARAKVESGQVDFAALATAINDSLAEKHILVNLNDPSAEALLAEAGWNGKLSPGQGDYLQVVDTNVGWNKVNSLVDRSTSYHLVPAADGSGRAELTLTYSHRGEAMQEPCVHESRYGDTYDDMVRRCYFDYIRVYVPSGAQLLEAQGFEADTLATLPGEHGTTVLAGFLVVPPGQERQVRLTYTLPPTTFAGDTYQLRVQKQAGTPSWPMEVTVADASGTWRPFTADGQTTADGVVYQLRPRGDLTLELQREAR